MTSPTHHKPSDRTLADVDAVFRRLVDSDVVPGISYGVVSRAGIVHAAGYGVAREADNRPDAATVFRIASMTKSFTAAAVMILVEQGALNLTDPVSRYVPEFGKVQLPTSDSPQVTIGMLLSMSAGLPTDDAWADRQESMSRKAFGQLLIDGVRFVATPDTTYEYSNLGYAILGCVIEATSGLGYRDFVTRRLLRPLNMTSTGFDTSVAVPEKIAIGQAKLDGRWQALPFSSPGVFSPMGGLFSTVDDLARWVGWLADAFPAREGPESGPLSRASRREMQQIHRVIPQAHRDVSGNAGASGYGYGLTINHDPTLGTSVSHSGGYPGFGSHMRWHPATGLGVIALTNARYVSGRPEATAALRSLVADMMDTPDRGQLWPETIQARAVVEGLLREWDATVIEKWFADNIEMDLDLAHRRAQIQGLVNTVGPLTDPASPGELIRSDSSAHAVWNVRGARGMLRCEIRLNPQNPPRIQTLDVTVDDAD